MRQIEASEIKPGMEVEWTQAGVTSKCVPETVDSSSPRYGVNLHTSEGGVVHIPGNAEVTVLSEPQPEEPTEFGAAVETPHWSDRDGCQKFIWDGFGWVAECGNTYTWDALTEFGTVKVANPDPFAEMSSEVPERIEEWPEDDTALRAHVWRDRDGDTWKWLATVSGWECYDELDDYVESGVPSYGPWDRVTDA